MTSLIAINHPQPDVEEDFDDVIEEPSRRRLRRIGKKKKYTGQTNTDGQHGTQLF
jgi:hypothetical protein